MSEADCYRAAIGDGVDPSGTPWSKLDPRQLRTTRSSLKWTRFPEDTLPLFVAEMDFAVAPEIQRTLIERIQASDTGYLSEPGPLAPVFSAYAAQHWNWQIEQAHIYLATDVATGVVEGLRVGRPDGGRLAIPTPTYPGFFEMLQEVPFEIVEIPLAAVTDTADGNDFALDLTAIEAAFASPEGIDAFVLCNPHNPHGLPYSATELSELARLAATYDVFVVSDEVHAPLTHSDATFTPFAPLAAEAGAVAVIATSASKGWNLAGAKCSVLVAADDRANRFLQQLPPEVITRVSILGLHASITAFTEGGDWLARTVAQLEANQRLLASLVAERLPSIGYTRPRAGYLAWLDLRGSGLGDRPHARVLHEAKVALNNGDHFGQVGAGHARLNFACAPDTLVEAVDRIATILPNGVAA